MSKALTLTIGFPPSVNRYWRNVKGKTLLSEDGRTYRANTLADVAEQMNGHARLGSARLRVEILANPPDNRKRDVDNLPKGILDSLAFARVFDDDSQIDELEIRRGEVVRGGRVEVRIKRL